MTCGNLAELNPRTKVKICKKSTTYKNKIDPAEIICQNSCNSCDLCYENPKSKYFHGLSKK